MNYQEAFRSVCDVINKQFLMLQCREPLQYTTTQSMQPIISTNIEFENEIQTALNKKTSEGCECMKSELEVQPTQDIAQIVKGMITSVVNSQMPEFNKNGELVELYELIQERITQSKRNREEMVKYIIRKCLKFHQSKNKGSPQSRKKMGLEFKLPFRRESEIKTMNQEFLLQLFQCQSFVSSYEAFLIQLPQIIESDNRRKSSMLAAQVVKQFTEGDRKNLSSAIGKMRRLPWTKDSLRRVVQLATTLLSYQST